MEIVESAEVHEFRGLQAHAVNTFTDEAVAEVVDQVFAQDSRVADGDTLVVALVGYVRRIPRELGSVVTQASDTVILQVATQEQPVIAILREVIVQLQDISIQFGGSAGRELVATEVKAIPDDIRVRKRVLVEDLHDRWIGART